jgi:hypothetical protein
MAICNTRKVWNHVYLTMFPANNPKSSFPTGKSVISWKSWKLSSRYIHLSFSEFRNPILQIVMNIIHQITDPCIFHQQKISLCDRFFKILNGTLHNCVLNNTRPLNPHPALVISIVVPIIICDTRTNAIDINVRKSFTSGNGKISIHTIQVPSIKKEISSKDGIIVFEKLERSFKVCPRYRTPSRVCPNIRSSGAIHVSNGIPEKPEHQRICLSKFATYGYDS